ncbi:MAG TPA: DUF4406 domain-containing protein [Ruminococcaceae bacterium]|nr:DUF4406 domain-containing protein [Oscillospiraceae bacterium]
MKKIFICSAYRGNIDGNIEKAKEYCRWAAVECGVIPIAPHLFFPQFLDDDAETEREIGINMGLSLLKDSSELWYFGDSVTEGMKKEIDTAVRLGIPVRLVPESEILNIQNGGLYL